MRVITHSPHGIPSLAPVFALADSFSRPACSAMTTNMGTLDRLLRTLAAIGVGILYTTGTIGGTTALVLGVFAIAFLLTSFVGTCPLYMPLGLSTRRETRA